MVMDAVKETNGNTPDAVLEIGEPEVTLSVVFIIAVFPGESTVRPPLHRLCTQVVCI